MATVPSLTTQVTGGLAGAAWANSVKDGVDFLVGSGSNALPIAVVQQSVVQSVPASTWTVLTFTSELLDSDGMHSTATNTGRLTAVTAGWYLVAAQYGWGSHASSTRRIVGVRKNGGSAPTEGRSDTLSWGGSNGSVGITTMVQMSVGDYIEVVAYQDSGGALDTATSADLRSAFTAIWQRS